MGLIRDNIKENVASNLLKQTRESLKRKEHKPETWQVEKIKLARQIADQNKVITIQNETIIELLREINKNIKRFKDVEE